MKKTIVPCTACSTCVPYEPFKPLMPMDPEGPSFQLTSISCAMPESTVTCEGGRSAASGARAICAARACPAANVMGRKSPSVPAVAVPSISSAGAFCSVPLNAAIVNGAAAVPSRAMRMEPSRTSSVTAAGLPPVRTPNPAASRRSLRSVS
ncbi:MAG TPA: hypothetical protein VFL13_14610 [Candidatus Baltobacteraceae bacterium]|nr:hypothetical protein [Candidatus Baltobacteraceae bacterium]